MTKEKGFPFHFISKAFEALKTHRKVDLVVSLDTIEEFIDVRAATVMEIREQQIILSQTDPAVPISMIGREIEATFLISDESTRAPKRWGYRTKVLEISPNYCPKEKTESFPVLVIGGPDESLRETSLRFHHRIRPPFESHISIQIHSYPGEISLLDFSSGGMLVSYPGSPRFSEGQVLDFTLSFNGESSVSGQAEIKRIIYEQNASETQVAFKFAHMTLSAARHLQRMAYQFMRQEQDRSHRKFLNKTDLPAFNDSSPPLDHADSK